MVTALDLVIQELEQRMADMAPQILSGALGDFASYQQYAGVYKGMKLACDIAKERRDTAVREGEAE